MSPQSSPPPLALTHSSWINAWTLHRACAAFGVALRVDDAKRELPLPRWDGASVPRWLFLTEERSLARALAGALPGRYLPSRFPPELLDDKWAFAEWLAQDTDGPQGLRHWPIDDADAVYPLLLKCRHSWHDGRKLPRGWVCRNADELSAARRRLAAENLDPAWFFLQQWRGDASMRLISVAGFFDADDEARNLSCVTDRLASYGAGASSSALLATVDDDWRLGTATARVLRRLHYRGPYEMEFIVSADAPPRVLELNPRFWMQHGIFLALGNGLVQRYLGLDAAGASVAQPSPRVLWADGVWLLRRLLRLDGGVLALLWRKRVTEHHRIVVCPSLPAALGAAWWRLWGGAR